LWSSSEGSHDGVDAKAAERVADNTPPRFEIDPELGDVSSDAPALRSRLVKEGFAEDESLWVSSGNAKKSRDIVDLVLSVSVDLKAVCKTEITGKTEPIDYCRPFSAVFSATPSSDQTLPFKLLHLAACFWAAPVVNDKDILDVRSCSFYHRSNGRSVVEGRDEHTRTKVISHRFNVERI